MTDHDYNILKSIDLLEYKGKFSSKNFKKQTLELSEKVMFGNLLKYF